jgi:hypothetical protein
MPLSEEQRTKLAAAAKSRGVDPAALIREAEKLVSDSEKAKPPGASAKGDKPNLYLYHLPFVTVNEVRTIWLDLDPVPGGDEYAAVWSTKQSGTGSAPPEGQS